jgi:hypothetical protein
MASSYEEPLVSPEQEVDFWTFRAQDLRTAFENLTGKRFGEEVQLAETNRSAPRPIGYLDGNLSGFEDWANY